MDYINEVPDAQHSSYHQNKQTYIYYQDWLMLATGTIIGGMHDGIA